MYRSSMVVGIRLIFRMVESFSIILTRVAITERHTTKFQQEWEGYTDMNSMEQKKRNEVLSLVVGELQARFEKKLFGKNACMINQSGIPFRVCPFPDEMALVIEYAENDEDAESGRFEDGDRFYLADYSVEDLIDAMLIEISQATQDE